MAQPLVIAHHLIWTTYGSWLPNDPRGSGSLEVVSDPLAELGELHFGRKIMQPAHAEIRQFYQKAVDRLDHPVLRLDRAAIVSAACGLATAIAQHRYTCYACAVMPDHVHMIVRKHKHSAETMVERLKLLSRERLVAGGNRDPMHHGRPRVAGISRSS